MPYVPSPPAPGETIFETSKRRRAERQAYEEQQKQLQALVQDQANPNYVPPEGYEAPFPPLGNMAPEARAEGLRSGSLRENPFIGSLRDTGVPEPFLHVIQAMPSAKGINTVLDYVKTSKTGAGDAPSSVREWQFFNSLSRPEQAQFLQLKRQGYQVTDVNGVPTMAPRIPGLPVIPLTSLQSEVSGQAAVVAGKKEAEVKAGAQAQAAVDLPDVLAKSEETVGLIDDLIKHPGKRASIGVGGLLPKIPGTEQANFITRLEQLQGKQFLEAYQALKGAGQITEIEGTKAEQSLARMSRAQTVEEWDKSAREFQAVIKRGMERARKKAGAPPEPSRVPVQGSAPKKIYKYEDL